MKREIKIQTIVFPKEPRHMMCEGLFYSGNNGFQDRETGSFILGTGQKIDLATYLNSCSWAKWKKYTGAISLSLHLDIEGSCDVCYKGYNIVNRRHERLEYGYLEVREAGRREVVYTFPESDDTLVAAEICAMDRCVVYGGYYSVLVDRQELNEIELAIATTTCRKEEFIKKNVALLRKEILEGDDELKEHLSIHVTDNGRTLAEQEITGGNSHIFLHPNPNTGGSGGYARGMMEAMHQEIPATHVLLMDDDVLVLPESIRRTYHLLQLLKPEYKDHFINGAMLRYENPYYQVEDVGTLNRTENTFFHPLKPELNLKKFKKVVMNDGSYFSAERRYGGWWYSCIPASVIKKNGLPLPYFIKIDDIEFSMRNNAEFITMNGICVWHMGFELKYNPVMENYQQCRNMMITNAVCDRLQPLDVYGYFRLMFHFAMLKYCYGDMELILRGMEDYMKGPSFLEKADGEQIIKEMNAFAEKMEPMSIHPEVIIGKADDIRRDEHWDERNFNWMKYTRNGHRGPVMRDRGGAMPAMPVGVELHWAKIARRREYAAVNIYNETLVIRRRDREKYRLLMKRMKAFEKEYEKHGAEVAESWRKAFPYLTSEEFWRKYLGI